MATLTKLMKWSYDLRSYERNCIEKPEKFRTSTGFEPVTSRYRCDALTNSAMKPLTLGVGHLWVHIRSSYIWSISYIISSLTKLTQIKKILVLMESTRSLGIEPRPHWWEASALTTAPSLHPYVHVWWRFAQNTLSEAKIRNLPPPLSCGCYTE